MRGYRVVRVERVGSARVVYYHLGRGQDALQRMVIRIGCDRVLFEETDPSVLVDVDVDLNR